MFGRKRSFTAVSSAQWDELRAELPTLSLVSVAVIAKKLGTSSSTAWRVLHNRLEKKPYKPIKAQRVWAAARLCRLAFCRDIRLRLGRSAPLVQGTLVANFEPASGLLQRRKGLQMRVSPASAELQVLGGPHPEAHGLHRPSPHRQIAVQSRHHGGHDRRLERHLRRALCGTRGQGQQRLPLRTHVAAVLMARHPRESCDERAVSLLREQRAQPRVGLHSRVHSAEQAAQRGAACGASELPRSQRVRLLPVEGQPRQAPAALWNTCGAPRGHPAPGLQPASRGDPAFHLLLATEAAAVPQSWWRTLQGLSHPISMAPCAKTRTKGVYGVFFLFRGRIQRCSTQVTLSPVFICDDVCVTFGSSSSFVIGSTC